MSSESRPASRPPQQAAPRLDRDTIVAGLKRYLDAMLRTGHFNLTYEIEVQGQGGAAPEGGNAEIVARLDGPDRDLLLERGGELLQALEDVAVRSLRLERELHDRVRLDCGTFHADRLAELQLSAKVAAQRVRETHTEFRFNPMSSADRRIVHLALHGAPEVRTASEGVGDQRRVVIFPASAR